MMDERKWVAIWDFLIGTVVWCVRHGEQITSVPEVTPKFNSTGVKVL